MDGPPHETVERARMSLNRDRHTSRLAVIWSAVGVALGLGLAILAFALGAVLLVGVALPILVTGASLFCFYAVALSRSVAAGRVLDEGPYQRVHVVGWTRPPDGCNLGLFLSESRADPDVVVRLPTVRSVTSADGWVAGDVTPSLGRVGRVVAVFRNDGEILGAGAIVATYVGRERWAESQRAPDRLSRRSGVWRPVKPEP